MNEIEELKIKHSEAAKKEEEMKRQLDVKYSVCMYTCMCVVCAWFAGFLFLWLNSLFDTPKITLYRSCLTHTHTHNKNKIK